METFAKISQTDTNIQACEHILSILWLTPSSILQKMREVFLSL